ncbi:hypothetical protein VTN02DRAFT_6114 [Thermoascus thermophilus]
MFRNRRTSQRPDDELICSFKETFPHIVTGASTSLPEATGNATCLGPAVVEPVMPARPVTGDEDVKLPDPPPGALQDFRLAPSLMDPNSFAFVPLASQPPGYYTPDAAGMNALDHQPGGDLHTLTLGLNLMAPLSIPNPIADPLPLDPTAEMNLHHSHHQYLPPQFQSLDPLGQQTSYAPSSFVHRDSARDPLDQSAEEAPLDDVSMQVNASLNVVPPVTDFPEPMDIHPAVGEKFRYNATLRAPTAMVRQPDEIPVTYLNKGQAYSLSVVDTGPPPNDASQPVKYRTYVRVSFEDEQQRSKPAACWQLWKEGRGSNEAHQRGGKLLAVEYVDPIQGGDEEHRHPQIELESASFDGFCVTWTPNPVTGSSDCAISVRFNFLSTDFSHSKGVKGIPVRLCAKTEMLSPNNVDPVVGNEAEVCYCKVKLFRDHGAERKLSNDVAHVKKMIDKLKQQIAQAELGANFGKRKRSSGAIPIKGTDNRPLKILKHKRTWSMDSQNDVSGKLSIEEDLHLKLAMMQDMFSSTRPVSVLNLRGDEQDDPDLFPVSLPGESPDFFKLEGRESRPSFDATSGISNVVSPTNSSVSMNSPVRPSTLHHYKSRDSSRDRLSVSGHQSENSCVSGPTMLSKRPVKVQKLSTEGSNMSNGFIEALDIDPTYRPPSERPPKPIACFYVRFPTGSDQQIDDYYRAIYLSERTVRDFMNKISEKQQIDPGRIIRVLRVNQDGLKIMVDDDVVRELPDGQDMVAEISDASRVEDPVANPDSAVEIKLTY